ncbi:MAG: WYL domain-containing protein [Deltaproteobacteria bacterium]|nr:WYL domain-containing protein [Deltaproteobacteria bacterium]
MARTRRQPKDVVLLQLAILLSRGVELSYQRLADEFLLERRTAERYLRDLRHSGLPVVTERDGRSARFTLDRRRARFDVEAIDVPPSAARSLSLLMVAAQLLPAHLGVREAVDRTVRAALRLRGMKAAAELRRLEDAVLVLENDAKDYQGKAEVFAVLVDAVLEGQRVTVRYRSPKGSTSVEEQFFPASIGLYKGGLYVLAVPAGDDGTGATWRALERVEGMPHVDRRSTLKAEVRRRAIAEARARWGPARPRGREQVITLHFGAAAAPYVLARPWHERAEAELWPQAQGGGLRMSLRLSGQTDMFESWVKSWGAEVQVLRPRDMAERIAADLASAALRHREAAARFARDVDAD